MGSDEAIRMARVRSWQKENAAAIEAYNRFIDKEGVPLGELRKF